MDFKCSLARYRSLQLYSILLTLLILTLLVELTIIVRSSTGEVRSGPVRPCRLISVAHDACDTHRHLKPRSPQPKSASCISLICLQAVLPLPSCRCTRSRRAQIEIGLHHVHKRKGWTYFSRNLRHIPAAIWAEEIPPRPREDMIECERWLLPIAREVTGRERERERGRESKRNEVHRGRSVVRWGGQVCSWNVLRWNVRSVRCSGFPFLTAVRRRAVA